MEIPLAGPPPSTGAIACETGELLHQPFTHRATLTPDAVAHQALETVRQVAEIVAGRVPVGAMNAEKATRLSRLR